MSRHRVSLQVQELTPHSLDDTWQSATVDIYLCRALSYLTRQLQRYDEEGTTSSGRLVDWIREKAENDPLKPGLHWASHRRLVLNVLDLQLARHRYYDGVVAWLNSGVIRNSSLCTLLVETREYLSR